MKGLIIIAFTSLLVAFAHSKTNTVSIPCNAAKVKKFNKNLSYDWTYSLPKSTHHNTDLKQRMSVSPDGTLLIRRFSDKDHGKYTCHIKSKDSTVEEVTVHVNDEFIEFSNFKKVTEQCPIYECIKTDKCDSPDVTKACSKQNDVCCPKLKEEVKHRCDHFLGECMPSCHKDIRVKQADDCPEGTQCCVLV